MSKQGTEAPDSSQSLPGGEPDPEAAERQEKVLWVLKGGGRWGLELNEIAWSVRLDERGRTLFPASQAIALARQACRTLESQDEIESREDFFRLRLWRHEPW